MTHERDQPIRRAVERAVRAFGEEQSSVGAGGLFELAYPFAAAEVPDAFSEEIKAAFASLWGIGADDRGLYEQILAVCDRYSPGDDETIQQVLQRASKGGDMEATYLLTLVKNMR